MDQPRKYPFRVNGCFRHDNCIDIDIRIEHIEWVGPKYVKALVTYLNRHDKYAICREKVKLRKEHYSKWKEIDGSAY